MLSDKEKIKLHKKTIKTHIKEVRKWCFKMGIPLQGLMHDHSKYSKEEMSIAYWYTGKKSPHDNARDVLGYSPSWCYHKAKNKHHWEWWCDFNSGTYVTDDAGEQYFVIKPVAVKMPYKYVIEMFCDYIGAGKAYSKDGNWNPKMPYQYHLDHKNSKLYHADTLVLFEILLKHLAQLGEKEFLKWYKVHKSDLESDYKQGRLYE